MWIALSLFAATACAQPSAERKRELEIRSAEMIAAAQLAPGARVADIGAGDGFLAARLSRAVGPSGRVWAVDIDRITALPALRKRRKKEKLRNLEVVAANQAIPALPFAELDAAFLVLSYHEVTAYREMLAELRRALKPGGRMVVVDLVPCRTQGKARATQAKAHALAPEYAEAEFRDAGFDIASRDDHFIDRPDEEQARWMIVCRRP